MLLPEQACKNYDCSELRNTEQRYNRLHLIYPRVIETVKDWADCEQLTPIEIGQIV